MHLTTCVVGNFKEEDVLIYGMCSFYFLQILLSSWQIPRKEFFYVSFNLIIPLLHPHMTYKHVKTLTSNPSFVLRHPTLRATPLDVSPLRWILLFRLCEGKRWGSGSRHLHSAPSEWCQASECHRVKARAREQCGRAVYGGLLSDGNGGRWNGSQNTPRPRCYRTRIESRRFSPGQPRGTEHTVIPSRILNRDDKSFYHLEGFFT